MISYFLRYHEKILTALAEHLEITCLTLVISVALAAFLTALIIETRRVKRIVLQFCSMVYAIPSLALFALLIPVTGIGLDTAVIVLVIYNQYILVRSFTEGLDRVDPAVVEAAAGMGMTRKQLFWRIRLPLALDAVTAGIRIAIVSTIGIATIAASIGAGGLGTLLFDGMRTGNSVKIFWGILLSAAQVLLVNGLLLLAERKLHSRIYHTPAGQKKKRGEEG